MKKILFTVLVGATFICNAQAIKENKVNIVKPLESKEIKPLNDDINSVSEFRSSPIIYFSCGINGNFITSNYLPFKVYEIPTDNLHQQQDIYNRIISQVPGVSITTNTLNESPKISMRGDSNTVYIIDGVKFYDASILNTFSTNDIESIKVAPNLLAQYYFR